MYNSVQLDTSVYFVCTRPFDFQFFQDGGQHFDDDCSTLMMIASSVASTLIMIASSVAGTLMMIASSVGHHFDDVCIFGQRSFEKKKIDLALGDFPYWLLCVVSEDSIWALGSCVHVCLLKILWRSPILKDRILFTCADVMVRCSVL